MLPKRRFLFAFVSFRWSKGSILKIILPICYGCQAMKIECCILVLSLLGSWHLPAQPRVARRKILVVPNWIRRATVNWSEMMAI